MTWVRPRLAGLVAAALVAAAGLVGISSGPAAAALCSGKGVNVVVDFHGLGGGVQKGCDPNGAGRSGRNVFPAAGFPLTFAARQAGFVCKVKGSPSNAPCQNTSPANAYWGLYWSNGKSGKWTYSSSGVSGTSVPNGGFLAFSWQNGGSNDPPGAAPVNRSSAPATKAPTKSPTKKATPKAPTKKSTKQADAGSTNAPDQTAASKPTKKSGAAAEGTASAKKKAKASKSASAKARASKSPSASASSSASAVSEPSDDASSDVSSTKQVDSAFAPEDEQGGLPVWVPVVVIVALAGSAGGAAWWRRRTTAP